MSSVGISIDVHGHEFAAEFHRLWSTYDENSFFRSREYLRLIGELTGAELAFVVASAYGEAIAALPIAIANGRFGRVINSLPYYGTYSSVVPATERALAQAMVAQLLEYARSRKVATVTLIDDWRSGSLSGLKGATFETLRTNQFINLVRFRGQDPRRFYHQKTRNLVRKAEKLGVKARVSDDVRDIDALASTHRINMADVKGIPKPDRFFDELRNPLRPLGDHRLYVASLDGRDCAYLLFFYCGDTVEYYMPAVKLEDRINQPLSMIIHTAIHSAVVDGFAYLNFGGTWPTQNSLRHFKIRWGSEEIEYRYLTYVLDPTILRCSGATLLAEYPYFFVAPFEEVGCN